MSELLLFKAVKNGNQEAVRQLLAENPDLVHARDKDQSTPLHWAAWKGYAQIVDILVAAGADVHAHNANDHWGTTPLHAAAHANQKAAAEALLKHGADINAVRASGVGTPLDETKFHNASAVAKMLRERGGVESA